MLSALFRVTERLFPFGRFDSHAFTLGFRERMVLDAGQREGITAIMESRGHCAHEPVFEDPHAPNTALIKVAPMLHQGIEFHGERDLFEEGEQYRRRASSRACRSSGASWKRAGLRPRFSQVASASISTSTRRSKNGSPKTVRAVR